MDHLRVLSRSERQQLADLRDRGGTIGIRAGILLSVQDGLSDREIAERLGTTRQRVSRWRMRMMESEYTSVLELVEDAPRSGRPRLSDGRVLLATAELGGGSADEVGEAAEVSAPTVRSVWRRWEVVSKPDLRSGRGVLAGEIERLAAVYVNPPGRSFRLLDRAGARHRCRDPRWSGP